LCLLYAAGHYRPGGIAKLYDLLMDVGFNSATQKLRGNKAATVIAVKNLGRCFALAVRPLFVHPL